MALSKEMRAALLESTSTAAIRNHSGKSVECIAGNLMLNGVELAYGDMKVVVERRCLDEARKEIADRTPEQRSGIRASVDAALRSAYPKIEAGEHDKRLCDNFYSDLLLWTALKEIASQ